MFLRPVRLEKACGSFGARARADDRLAPGVSRSWSRLVSHLAGTFRAEDARMSMSVEKRNVSARAGQSTARVVIVSATFGVLLATAWLLGRDLIDTNTRVPADIYRGTVQLAPDELGRCDLFDYDNKTGWMTPKGSIACDDIAAALPARSSGSGSLGRLNGMRNFFKPR
jgi:hypothetical protein